MPLASEPASADPAAVDWLARVQKIRRQVHKKQRAPHKPLLILYALGRLRNDHDSRVRYETSVDVLKGLLSEYGRPGKPPRLYYPFQYLANDDGLWVVTVDDEQLVTAGAKPLADGALNERHAVGRFSPEFEAALLADSSLVDRIATYLLESNWPPSLHDDILSRVGLTLSGLTDPATEEVASAAAEESSGGTDSDTSTRRRDPAFRGHVLLAYERRCAVCGWGGRLDASPVALDAAHIQWWANEGPDAVSNGLCLCVLHHKLFDTGAIGLTDDLDVCVSQHFLRDDEMTETLVLAFSGKPMRAPQDRSYAPNREFVKWHREQVFREPARVAKKT